MLSKDEQGHSSGAGPGADGHIFTLSENGSFTPVGVFAPMSEKTTGKRPEGQPHSAGESMLLKWRPPQIVNSKDDASPEAVVRFMKETDKQEKE
ncbi:hypothetical protein MU943_004185 [Escherichia coli]|nr:hypothetical protein [Escherichia coli]EFI1484807.1 hypothetical protein [Escherichia coli]EIQ0794213.1 hypothetical protein [Escherichia coli]EIQ2013422.1 hypothetical protein [Escherichia coli]EJA4333003.1 hypothetical protein [Escherichia coli]